MTPTASQTVGPFFSIGLSYRNRSVERAMNVIVVSGTIFDGENVPVPDAQIEIWRADTRGRYNQLVPYNPANAPIQFDGFARIATDDRGVFAFETVLPGKLPGPEGKVQAPHIVAVIFMRGLLLPLYTRIYFAGQSANASDPIFEVVPEDRRATLLAVSDGENPNCYRWDVHLQGNEETVFFTY